MRTLLNALLFSSLVVPVFAWDPPIGVPHPQFGVEENLPTFNPANIRHVYVDNTAPQCGGSNTSAPSYALCQIPQNLGPGAYVEIHGGPYNYNNGPSGEVLVNGIGTLLEPVIIHGVGMPRINRKVLIGFYSRAKYLILDGVSAFNVTVAGPDPNNFNDATEFISVRHCEIRGDLNSGGASVGGGVRGGNPLINPSRNIIFYHNAIHDNGDWLMGTPGHPCICDGAATEPGATGRCDQDVHGIAVAGHSSNIWIVDNEMYHNSGNGVQVNAGGLDTQATTHHIFMGRNNAHDNKQVGLWTKQAVDVIFSENVVYNQYPAEVCPSDDGGGMGHQYGPERTWFLFNEIYNSKYGIVSGSRDGGFGTETYLIGNYIHDIHRPAGDSFNPNTSWSNAGISLQTVRKKVIVGNTIVNVDAGINLGGGEVDLANNIVMGVSEPLANHVFFEDTDPRNNPVLRMKNNLFWQDGQTPFLRLANTRYQMANLPAEYECTNCLIDNPDLASGYRLSENSPAIDAGEETIINNVAASFLQNYGLDIRYSLRHTRRPQSGVWDIGADEFDGTPPPPDPPLITSHPSSVSVAEGASATFSVAAFGAAPLVYQWRKNGIAIVGATQSTYSTPPVSLGDNGAQFSCVVSNSYGTATSNAAILSVGGSDGQPARSRRNFSLTNNPFYPLRNQRLQINLELPSGEGTLRVYDRTGKEVRTLLNHTSISPSGYQVEWDGRDNSGALVPSGVYILRLKSGDSEESKKAVLLK